MKDGKNVRSTGKQALNHLLIVGIYTVFSFLLAAATLLNAWETWTVPLIVLSIAAVWGVHIGQLWTEARRGLFYTGLMLLEFFIYGAHPWTFGSLPVIMCLLIMTLLSFQRTALIYAAVGTYAVVILYQWCFMEPVDIFATKVALNAAAVASCVLIAKFLIDRRQTEQKQIDKALAALEDANRRSEDFLANVSHELRTPINAVMGISDIMLQRELSPDLRKDVVSIQQAGRRLVIIINNILDYTDLLSGHMGVNSEEYLLSSSINDWIVMSAAQNEDRGLELVFDVDADIPSVLIGDEAKIRRVLGILMENAIKFTDEGGVYAHIGCRSTADGVNLNIRIQDTGIGMTPQQLSRIYDQFYQADSGRDRKAGGLGLGLTIAHALIHSMGGFMSILSEPGKSTQVQVSIPQKIADRSPCMTLRDVGSLNVACYFGLDACAGEVREFYKRMLSNFGTGLGLKLHVLHQAAEFRKFVVSSRPTHVFLTQEEYQSDTDFYNELGKDVVVTVITGEGFTDSPLLLLQKPFCAFPIVNILNESKTDSGIIAGQAISCSGVKVLVVDDEEMNLLVAKGIFSAYGMEVDTCLGGEAALEQCRRTEYDAVFLDHMMPGMDGVETLKRLRAMDLYQSVPVVALTANAVSGAREMFKSEGFNEFVAKPIERSALERAMRRIFPGKWKLVHDTGPAARPVSPVKPSMSEAAPEEAAKGSPAETPEEAPAAEETPAATSPVSRLAEQGFDVKTGISYCAGSEDFYVEMLQNFLASAPAKQAEIDAFHAAGDWENYIIKVHALKSSARTIGANSLSSCAAGLEQAGKDRETAYIAENHPKLMELYETCRTQIRTCLGGPEEARDAEENQNTAPEVSEDTWQAALEGISDALAAFDGFRAGSAVKELHGYARHGQSCEELFQTLLGYVEDYDFEAAADELGRLSEGSGTL